MGIVEQHQTWARTPTTEVRVCGEARQTEEPQARAEAYCVVPWQQGVLMQSALADAGVSAELGFRDGGHQIESCPTDDISDQFLETFR